MTWARVFDGTEVQLYCSTVLGVSGSMDMQEANY